MTNPAELLDRLPPQDLDAERGVLGAILLDPDRYDDVAGLIQPEDFYADGHRRLYDHLAALHNARLPLDSRLLVDRLRQKGDMEAVGGAAYLAEVIQSPPISANAVYYARIVRNKARLRTLIHAAADVLQAAYDGQDDADAIIGRLDHQLRDLEFRNTADAPQPIAEVVNRVVDLVDAMQSRQEHLGVKTGLYAFDQAIGGLFPGELSVLAARTSVGKTALACQIAQEVAATGRLVCYVSLEMTAATLVMRQASALSGVSLHHVRSRRLADGECGVLLEALRTVSQGALVLHDRPRMGTPEVTRAARRLARGGLALLVVDYLQLLQVSDARAQRYRQLGQLMGDLKALTTELNIPVVVLCQLSRAAEEQTRPELRHLRESGDIEQDADVVLMIHRPRDGICETDGRGKPIPGSLRWDAELLVRKNRNGPLGEFRLNWDAARTRFSCWDDRPMGPFD